MRQRFHRARSGAIATMRRLGRPVKRRLHRWVGTRSGSAGVQPDERIHRLRLTADSVEWLECYAATQPATSRVHQLDLTVRRWRRPQPGWSGRLGPLPDLISWAVNLPPSGAGPARVQLRVGRGVAVQDAVTAVVSLLRPNRRLLYPATAELTVAGGEVGWLAGTSARSLAAPLPPSNVIRAYDTVLTGLDRAVAQEDAGQVIRPSPVGPMLRDRAAWPMLNLTLAHPFERGRKSGPQLGAGVLELAADAWKVRLGHDIVARGRYEPRPFSPGDRSALRRVGVVGCRALPAVGPGLLAVLLVHLAATGVVLDVPSLPEPVAGRLGPRLRAVFAEPLPDPAADPTEWEIRSVRQRTAAIREHAPAFVLRDRCSDAFPALRQPPSVSALVVTHRPAYVDSILTLLERQSYPELEVVLCLHGADLPPEVADRIGRSPLSTELVTVDSGWSFGEAVGEATARASGSFVTKLDDDDSYGPEHIWDLMVARAYSRATMVGKAAEFVYVEPLDATLRRETLLPEVYGDPVAGGTMLIGRGELEELGGWRPVPRSVDRGLLDRMLREGGAIYRTHPFGYLYERRSSGHTWDIDLEFLLRGVKTQWPGRLSHPEFGTATPPVPVSASRPAGTSTGTRDRAS